jgi:hypothetical protein
MCPSFAHAADWTARRSPDRQPDVPNGLLQRTVSQLAAGIDRAFAETAMNPPRAWRGRSRAEGLGHDQRLLALRVIASFYNRPEFLSRDSALLPRPRPITPRLSRVRAYGRSGQVLDLSWPSEFEPLWSEAAVAAHVESLASEAREALALPAGVDVSQALRALGIDRSGELREKYLRARANQNAHARWFRHRDGPRPCIVLIHGYMSGHYAIEERMWPLRRLFESGLDVALTVLPLHGLRRAEARGYLPPSFPSSDPRFTIEGFRQLVFDHRALFDFLLAGRAASLGVMGMSLGGYSAALLATLESTLQFAVMFVPLAAIEDFAHRQGRMVGSVEQQLAQRDALGRAQWPISPFARPSLVPSDRSAVLAGEADQVTGLIQGRRLAEHFGAPLSLFHGGHLLHAGRSLAFVPAWRAIERAVGVNVR